MSHNPTVCNFAEAKEKMNTLKRKHKRVRGCMPTSETIRYLGDIQHSKRIWEMYAGVQNEGSDYIVLKLALQGSTNKGKANYKVFYHTPGNRMCGARDLYALANFAPSLLIAMLELAGIKPDLYGSYGATSIAELAAENHEVLG